MSKSIEERLSKFKEDLTILDASKIFRKHIAFGECYWLDHELYYELKQDIATKFSIHPSDVVMVGSGKLGFSISEKVIKDKETNKIIETKPKYRAFGDQSDLDIAILSSNLFDEIWYRLYEYKKTKSYWPREKKFIQYLFEGWIRPDKLPPSTTGLEIQQDWFEFFSGLTNSGKYGDLSITAGLYKNWGFLEGYQIESIINCKKALELE